jgi:hypothetical protein
MHPVFADTPRQGRELSNVTKLVLRHSVLQELNLHHSHSEWLRAMLPTIN